MSDIFSVLQNAYATAPLSPTNTKYTPVDPKSYQGTWTGTYSNNQKFEFTISNVNGFRAQVKYQSGGDDAVSAGVDREFVVSHRRQQIRADGQRQGHGRKRGDRSYDRQHQPGPMARRPSALSTLTAVAPGTP